MSVSESVQSSKAMWLNHKIKYKSSVFGVSSPEPVPWVFLSDWENKREIPHEDEQTVTVTHSSAVLKGALSSFSKNLLMKANCLSKKALQEETTLLSCKCDWLAHCDCWHVSLHKWCIYPRQHNLNRWI